MCMNIKRIRVKCEENEELLCQYRREYLGRVVHVTCLATDTSLTADQGVASRSHTFVEIYYGIISTVILLPSADTFMKDCYQYGYEVLVNYLFKLVLETRVVR